MWSTTPLYVLQDCHSLPLHYKLHFTCGQKGKRASQVAPVANNSPANARDKRDIGLIPGSGRSPGEGNGNSLQCICLDNSMHRRAWWATAHGG